MKNIILILLLFCSGIVFSQTGFPNKPSKTSNKLTLINYAGGVAADSGFQLICTPKDTFELNMGWLDEEPGIMERTGDSLWMRSKNADEWLLIGANASATGGFGDLYKTTHLGDSTNSDMFIFHAADETSPHAPNAHRDTMLLFAQRSPGEENEGLMNIYHDAGGTWEQTAYQYSGIIRAFAPKSHNPFSITTAESYYAFNIPDQSSDSGNNYAAFLPRPTTAPELAPFTHFAVGEDGNGNIYGAPVNGSRRAKTFTLVASVNGVFPAVIPVSGVDNPNNDGNVILGIADIPDATWQGVMNNGNTSTLNAVLVDGASLDYSRNSLTLHLKAYDFGSNGATLYLPDTENPATPGSATLAASIKFNGGDPIFADENGLVDLGAIGGDVTDDWHIAGNAGTDPSINFVGTTDPTVFKIKANNQVGFVQDPVTDQFGFGGEISSLSVANKFYFNGGSIVTSILGTESIPALKIGDGTGGTIGFFVSSQGHNLRLSTTTFASFEWSGSLNSSAVLAHDIPRFSIGKLSPTASLDIYASTIPTAYLSWNQHYDKSLLSIANSDGDKFNIDFTGGTVINRVAGAIDPNAVFDVNDTKRGVLFPRMTTAQRDAGFSYVSSVVVDNPGTGYSGAVLISFTGGSPGAVAIAHPNIGATAVTSIPVDYNGYGYSSTPTVAITGSGTGATAHAVMSTSISEGMLIYNTDSSAFQYWNSSAWVTIGAGSGGSTPSWNATLSVDNTAVAKSVIIDQGDLQLREDAPIFFYHSADGTGFYQRISAQTTPSSNGDFYLPDITTGNLTTEENSINTVWRNGDSLRFYRVSHTAGAIDSSYFAVYAGGGSGGGVQTAITNNNVLNSGAMQSIDVNTGIFGFSNNNEFAVRDVYGHEMLFGSSPDISGNSFIASQNITGTSRSTLLLDASGYTDLLAYNEDSNDTTRFSIKDDSLFSTSGAGIGKGRLAYNKVSSDTSKYKPFAIDKITGAQVRFNYWPSVSGLVSSDSTDYMISPLHHYWNLAGDSSFVTIIANGIGDTLIRQSAALSIIGRSLNSTGNVADITAGTDNYVLRRSGTTLAFGLLANASLTNSTISGISLGSNLNDLTAGYGLSGSTFNGGTARTWAVDSATLSGKYLRRADSILNVGWTTLYQHNKTKDSIVALIGVGGGGVTSVATGYGLSGGTITSTGTLIVDSSALSVKYLRRADSILNVGWTTLYQRNKLRDSIIALGYITGNQTITLSGDVSGSGTTAITTTIGAGKVTNTMLAGSIAYSKLSLTGAILNADLAGSIAYSKLSLTGAIVDGDLATSYIKADGTRAMTGNLNLSTFKVSSTQTAATANTVVEGVNLYNLTTASSGNQSYSPSLLLGGYGWKTTAAAGQQLVENRLVTVPVQGTTAPSGFLNFDRQINGGGWLTIASVSSAGILAVQAPTTPGSGFTTGIQGNNESGSELWSIKYASGGSAMVKFNTPTALPIAFFTNATEAFRADVSQNVGIGTGATVSAKLHVIKTTEQIRSGYDASNYWNATTGSTGSTTFDAVGSGAAFTFSDAVTMPKVNLTTGANTSVGNATLVAGTVTVTTTAATSSSLIILTRKTSGGTIGTSITYTTTSGSFTITSDNILDTSVFTYLIIN